jgi:hypothetical protein
MCVRIHTHTHARARAHPRIYIYRYIYILAVPGHALLWPFPVTDWMISLRYVSSTSLSLPARITRSPSQSSVSVPVGVPASTTYVWSSARRYRSLLVTPLSIHLIRSQSIWTRYSLSDVPVQPSKPSVGSPSNPCFLLYTWRYPAAGTATPYFAGA